MLSLRIEVTIYDDHRGDRLNVHEEIELGSDLQFLEIAKILGVFHDLANKIKQERQPVQKR
jgi:hypothetical protein